MVITHEPPFWIGNDNAQGFVKDAVYLQKLQFIRDNNVVVWRFHDNLHARQPDMTSVGLAQAIGWERYASKIEARVYDLPRMTRRLAEDVRDRGAGAVDPRRRSVLETMKPIG